MFDKPLGDRERRRCARRRCAAHAVRERADQGLSRGRARSCELGAAAFCAPGRRNLGPEARQRTGTARRQEVAPGRSARSDAALTTSQMPLPIARPSSRARPVATCESSRAPPDVHLDEQGIARLRDRAVIVPARLLAWSQAVRRSAWPRSDHGRAGAGAGVQRPRGPQRTAAASLADPDPAGRTRLDLDLDHRSGRIGSEHGAQRRVPADVRDVTLCPDAALIRSTTYVASRSTSSNWWLT